MFAVILAPFGLAGTLTGQIYKSADISARLLDEWSHFYPLDKSNNILDSNMIEVIVGGVKMRYPSCYVFVTDMDDQMNMQILNNQQQGGAANPANNTTNETTSKLSSSNNNGTSTPILVQTPPMSPVQINSRVPQPGPYSVSVEHLNSMSREPTSAQILPERVWQECLLNGPQQQQEFTGNWDFVQPTRKINCTCSK